MRWRLCRKCRRKTSNDFSFFATQLHGASVLVSSGPVNAEFFERALVLLENVYVKLRDAIKVNGLPRDMIIPIEKFHINE